MLLPKVLLRVFRPFVFGLIASLIFLSYQQYLRSHDLAVAQSKSNVKMASALVWAQIEATFGKVDLLQTHVNSDDFTLLAKDILSNSYLYKNIARVDLNQFHYQPVHGASISQHVADTIKWNQYTAISDSYYVSSIYQKANGFWVFAVKQANKSNDHEVWVEFDVQHTTQYLANLKTLKDGYVFVIDAETGRLVFHPNPLRIGSPSVSFASGLQDRIKHEEKRGSYEYYYNGQYKVSVFDAQNPMNWIFVSGTNRADILFTSYQISLTAVVIFSLLFILLSINYITFQLNKALAKLNTSPDIAHFKHDLKTIFDQFTFHKGMQLCLYEHESGRFKTIDFHGNTKVIHQTKSLPTVLSRRELNYVYSTDADAVAQKLQIKGRYYAMPLYQRDNLIGVIYLKSAFFAFEGVMRAIRDFSEVALSNLLLFQELHSKDSLTGLDNKQAMRATLSLELRNANAYFAVIDIDGLGKINEKHGDILGDTIILYVVDAIKRNFMKPNALCLARDENGGFTLLFQASDRANAEKQLNWLRQMIAKQPINVHDQWIHTSITIGATPIGETPDAVLGRAKQSLQQAKIKGRNLVCFHG